MKFNLTLKNMKAEQHADAFHIHISLHLCWWKASSWKSIDICQTPKEEYKQLNFYSICPFWLSHGKTEPKISKETLFSFMEFMSGFLKDCYFNSFFEEKNPKLWNLIKCENGCRSELLLITYLLRQNEKILNFAWKARLILSGRTINMPQTVAPSNLCFESKRHFVTLN